MLHHRSASVASLAAVASALVFCTPFSADPDGLEDAGAADSGTIPDADNTNDADTLPDSALRDGGLGARRCFELATSSGDFTLGNGAVLEPNVGVRLPVSAPGGASLTRAFGVGQPIGESLVEVELSATAVGSNWSTDSFVDILTQYYGDPPALYETAANSLVFASGGPELNVWYAAGKDSFAGSHPVSAPLVLANRERLRVRTRWKEDGAVTIGLGNNPDHNIATKVSTLSRNKLTVSIGGGSNGSTPTVLLIVHSVCVTLFP